MSLIMARNPHIHTSFTEIVQNHKRQDEGMGRTAAIDMCRQVQESYILSLLNTQAGDVAEQIHTLTSCLVFKEGYSILPDWAAWGEEWEGDDEDGEGWEEEDEEEWYEEDEEEEAEVAKEAE